MLNELKKESLKKVLAWVVLWAVVAVGCFVYALPGVFAMLGGAEELSSLSAGELEGSYVKTDIRDLITGYAQTTRTGDGTEEVIEEEYVIAVSDTLYIGVAFPKETLAQVGQLVDEINAYYSGTGDVPSTVLSVKGTIEAMDYETTQFYHEALGYDSIAAEYQSQFPALVLKVNKVHGHTPTSLWLAFAGGLAALGICIWFLVRSMSGSYQKALLQFCAGTGDKDMALERVEAFYHDTQPVNGLRMNGAFTMFQNGAQPQLLRTPDVAWVYQVTTQHRVNFIPAGKSFAMRLWALDGRSWNLPMKKQEAVQNTMRMIFERFPHVLVGYSAPLVALAKKDNAAFRAQVAQGAQAQHAPQPEAGVQQPVAPVQE